MASARDAKTHKELRSHVCLICLQKLKTMRPITGSPTNPKENSLLDKIQKLFFTNFDPGNPKFPSAVCTHCYNFLIRTPDKLPDPPDYSQLTFPSRAQIRELKISSLDELKGCTCSLCTIGRQNFHHFSPTKSPAHKRGRPAADPSPNLPPRLPLRRPITICERCERVIGKGIPHPQNCSVEDRRENIQTKLEQDPIGYERAASKLIQKKNEESSGDTFKLATPGRSLAVPKLDKPSVSKALFKDKPVSQAAFNQMASQAHLTDNQREIVAQHGRVWHGRNTFEPNLRQKQRVERQSLKDFFTIVPCKLDHPDKKVRDLGELVDRKVFATTDLKSLVEHLCEIRGYAMSDTYLKVMADAGKSTTKICFTLEKLDLEGSNVFAKRSTYKDSGSKDMFKDSGVKRLQIIINVESCQESYFNMKKLWDLVKPYNFRDRHKLFTKAFDIKMNLIWHGLGTASSTYPCLYCTKKKIHFADEATMLQGGTSRTYGLIRENAEKYRLAVEKHTGSQKLSSAEFFNCERPPVDDAPDETKIIKDCPPMSLHLVLGIFNDGIFNILDRLLEHFELPIRGDDWTKAVGIERQKSHGGVRAFNGRQCHAMMTDNALQKLLQLLRAHEDRNAMSKVVNVIDVLHSFKQVVNSSFGRIKLASYKDDIKKFAHHYIKLMNYCHMLTVPINLYVTPKVHIVFVHVVEFLDIMEEEGLGNLGLSLYSEQSGETVHYDFDANYWIGKSYKRSMNSPDYEQNWFDCNLAYDTDHKGFVPTE